MIADRKIISFRLQAEHLKKKLPPLRKAKLRNFIKNLSKTHVYKDTARPQFSKKHACQGRARGVERRGLSCMGSVEGGEWRVEGEEEAQRREFWAKHSTLSARHSTPLGNPRLAAE